MINNNIINNSYNIDNTYNSLVKHIIPSMNINLNNFDFFLNGLRTVLLQHDYKYKHKAVYNFLRYDITFIPVEKREQVFDIFTLIQKHYFSLLNFSNICKFKLLSKKIDKQYDMFFNDLDDTPNHLKITLHEQTRLYTFKIFDILNIIKCALVNYEELFLAPSLPKNPYTNIAFSYNNLYNIFYFCQYNHTAIPKVFRYFYDCDFQLNKFVLNYEPIVRESVIISYYNNMSFNQKYETILDIINYYSRVFPIVIHDKYPKNNVVLRLEHCIVPYLRSQYSLNQSLKDINQTKVISILKSIHSNFGRVVFDTHTGTYIPIDQPKVLFDSSFSTYNWSVNNNSPNNPFVFGTNNPPNNINSNSYNINSNSYDMDINSDISENSDYDDFDTDSSNTNMVINIPQQNIITFDEMFHNRYIYSYINPIVRPHHITTISDLSLNSLSIEEINNARTRVREMLAGDDYID
tara:strand:+ start:79 stop:1467 length:1389 start_codon:yes stop_codon:yes gene_type:complete